MNRAIYKQGYIDGFTINAYNEDHCHGDYLKGYTDGEQAGYEFAIGRQVLKAALMSLELRDAKTTINDLLKDKALSKQLRRLYQR